MSLIIQFQCLFYSFLFGFIMTGVYHVVNRFLYGIPLWIRYIIQCCLGMIYGVLYFYGLVFFNEGIVRGYFLVFLFGGYLVYSRYYAYYLLYGLEKIVRFFKRIFSPFIFFFRYINGIIQKRIGRMKKKWQKRKHQDIKSS